MTPDLAAVERSLHAELTEWFAGRQSRGTGTPDDTIATNSTLLDRRGRPLVEIMRRRGRASLAGADVLDLGCGFGALSVYLAWHGARVTGVDRDPTLFAVGRRAADATGLQVELAAGDMRGLDLADERFDVALFNNTLCYLVEPAERRAALGEAMRLLRPGGLLVVREPNGRHPVDHFTGLPLLPLLGPRVAARTADRFARPRPLVRLTGSRALRRELRSSGFSAVRAEGGGDGAARLAPPLARYLHVSAQRPR